MTIFVQSLRKAAVVGAVALAPLLAACGSSAGSDANGSAASADTTTSVTSAATDVASSPAAAGKPVLADGEAPASRTITVTKTAFTPANMTIKTGENVTFKAGGEGTFGVEVGGLDSATVTGGLIETFDFPTAGTYEVNELVSGIKATITVE